MLPVLHVTGNRGNGSHDVAVIEIVIAIKLDFLIFSRTWSPLVIDQTADVCVELGERLWAVSERKVVKSQAG